jgi:hypothetical protein
MANLPPVTRARGKAAIARKRATAIIAEARARNSAYYKATVDADALAFCFSTISCTVTMLI